MKNLLLILGAAAALLPAPAFADPSPALRLPEEQKAWAAIAARFTEGPEVKSDKPATMELHLANLRGKPGSTGTASILVDKTSGHVLEVTSNSAAFTDAEFALFASFPELRALTLWHNGSFDGSGLAHLQKLPRLERITLAGGGLADAGLR